jgi:hypothetical protein
VEYLGLRGLLMQPLGIFFYLINAAKVFSNLATTPAEYRRGAKSTPLRCISKKNRLSRRLEYTLQLKVEEPSTRCSFTDIGGCGGINDLHNPYFLSDLDPRSPISFLSSLVILPYLESLIKPVIKFPI